jgi:membrane protein implicated in regulation of membrane protease activity
MDHNRPSTSEVLIELGGLAFTGGFITMAAAPFALPALVFGLLLLPLILPVLLLALVYGLVVALPRRYVARRRSRSSPSKTSTAKPPTRTTLGVPGSP